MADALSILIDGLRGGIQYHLDGLHGGQLDADAFQQGVAQDLLTFHTAAYLSGLDSDTLDATGRRAVVAAAQDQLDYLNGFADAIAAGDLSDDAITTRALSYAGSITNTWWQGATDGAELPFYPADGGTECGNNCRCEWRGSAGGWDWIAETDCCPGCAAREAGNPYAG